VTDSSSTLRVVDESNPPSCVHHWLLGDPTQGQVVGRCKRCGATRVYAQNPEGSERFDDYRELTQSASYWAGRQTA
jgi:hypothetical protein